MATYEPRLPGIDPVAKAMLTIYLHADGFISHYEVEARGPQGNLVRFRAQGSTGEFDHDEAYIVSTQYLLSVVREALSDLRGEYEPLRWPLDPATEDGAVTDDPEA